VESLHVPVLQQLLRLWNAEYPRILCHASLMELNAYLNKLGPTEHLLLLNETENVEGWAWKFNREGERWFAIILSGKVQGQGWGSALLERLRDSEHQLNGWVIDRSDFFKMDDTSYRSPMPFYEKCGFTVLPDVRLESDSFSAVKIRWTKL